MAASWKNSLLKTRHRFALDLGENRWGFGIVRSAPPRPVIRTFKRVDSMASGATTHSIASGTAAASQIWKDSNSKEYFKETATGKMVQTFFGISPPDIRVWLSYPGNSHYEGELDGISPAISSITESDPGWIDGDVSPFNDPTDLSEIIVLKNMGDVYVALMNRMEMATLPFFKFIYNRMNVLFLDQTKASHRMMIEAMKSEQKRAHFFKYPGGLEAFDLKTEYGVDPVSWDGEP